MVITDDSASVKLLTASSVIAIELVKNPTAALNAARRTFANIPITLVLTIVFSLFIKSLRFCYIYIITQQQNSCLYTKAKDANSVL